MKKLTILFLGFLAAATLSAAPFARWFDFPGAGGKTYPIYGEGDEFSAWFEAEDGHAVGFNDAAKAYEYLKPQADGSLVGTGILVGDEAGNESELAAIPLHARDTSKAHEEEVRVRIEEDDAALQKTERWNQLKGVGDATTGGGMKLMGAPSSPTVGNFTGCMLLVEFSDVKWPSHITKANMDTYANDENGAKLWNNTSSIWQFYHDVSCGKVSYKNVVIGPVTVPHPRSYYDDTGKDSGQCARLLIGDALDVLSKSASSVREGLSSVTKRDGRCIVLNVFFAGNEASVWSKGLWACQWTLASPITVDGVPFYTFQISPITSSPISYHFAHENGHALCGFPDLYNAGGAHNHCLMGNTCLMAGRPNDRDPQAPSAYLRAAAGWVDPKPLPNNTYVTLTRDYGDVYKYKNSNNENEYYLIENRGQRHDLDKTRHDGSISGSGIVIYHCMANGNNKSIDWNTAFSAETSNVKYRCKCEATLEQADGQYHHERNQWIGDANDFWSAGNTAADYPGEFSDLTVPTARWADGTPSGLVLSEFSANGDTMTFAVGTPVIEGAPTISGTITAGGYVGTGKLTISNFGTGASSADVFVDIYGEATKKTLVASVNLATGVSSTSEKTYTFPLVNGLASQYLRFRVVNNQGKAAYGTLTEAANGKAGDSTGGWGTDGGNEFGKAVDAPSLTINYTQNGAEWQKDTSAANYMTASSCLKFYGASSTSSAKTATLTATVAGPGTFTFYASSKLSMNGDMKDKTLGNPQCSVVFTAKDSGGSVIGESRTIQCKSTTKTGYTAYSVNLPSGNNTLTWVGSWIDPVSGTYNVGNVYIDKFLLEKNVAATIPIAKITTSSLLPDRATVGVQVTDMAGESSVNVTSIVVSPNSDYSSPVHTGNPGLVTGLEPLTRYYVKATLTGASGTTYPAIGSFVTPDWTKPTGSVTVSSVQHYSATVDVSVTNPGSETAANIVKTVTVARDSSFAEVVKNGASVPCDLTGLDAGTTYYVRGILTGPLTGDTYVETTFTTLSASYPLIGSVASSDIGTDRIAVNVTVSGFGAGSTGGTVLVEAVAGGVVAASANGTASGVYELTGLDRDTSYTIRVTITGSNGLSTTDESLVVKTLNVPVILADPTASIGEEGASATMSARVAFRESTVTDSNVKLYLTKSGESETLAKTWNSYAQGDVLSFMADTDPNVDYTYRFVATTTWNSKNWTSEAAGEFRTEYYVTNDWLTVDFESYEVDSALPASDASGAWTKNVGGVYESASSVVDFASEFGKGKGLDQSGESTYAKYTATAARPDGIRCLFDADMYFTVCKNPPESLSTEVLASATTAIFLYSGDEANNFRVYTADGWTDVFAEGFEPASKTFHHVTIDVDYDVSPARVRFTVDGHLLADANGVKWFNRANPSKADKPTAVSVYGNTKLDGFSAKMLEYGNTACPHANKQMTSAGQDATCTEPGHTAAYYCPDCERVWASVEIPALGHAWNNGEITKPATYRETGVMTYTCTREGCGETRTETIEKPVCPHAHTTVTGAKAATCTTAGSTGTETCDDCDAIIHAASVISALGHAWDAGVVTQEPTRTAEGVRTFTCTRTGCGATRTESIPMLPNIAAMRNIALVATVGQTLTLPAKVRGLKPDATLGDEYTVAWQQSSVKPTAEGVTTVTGTVTVSPLTFDVKATIRAVKVSNPDTTPVNIAPDATGNKSGTVMFDRTLPTSSGKASTGSVSMNGDVSLTWSDDKIISKAVIYFFSNNKSTPSTQPTYSAVKFKNGNTEIGYGSPSTETVYSTTKGQSDKCVKATYTFTSPVTLSALTITLPASNVEELEVYGTDVPTTATADPLTTDTLASLKVDNVAVPGFVSTTYSYTVTDGEAITSATATDNANMGITILPKDNEKAYVVTLAENGSTKTYTVSMPPSVVCTHEHTTVTGAKDATCTAAGSTGTETCDDCHAVIREATVIQALGHDWSDWAVTKEASKTETGLRERNCRRDGCNAHEEEVIPMIVDIATLRNIAVVTAVGTAPTLPAKVAGLKADGTVGGEYDVVWNTASAPSAVGITPVTGTAQVNGTPMTVTASVRAANAPTGDIELVNVAPLASSMVVTTPGTTEWNSSLADTSAITNGWGAEMTIGAWNNPGNYWQIYTGGNVALTVDVDFAWATPKKISKIFIATRDDSKQATITLKDGSGGNVISPTSYKIDQNDYYKINGGDGHLIEFSTPVELSALHIDAVKDPVGRMLGFFEIEVWAEGEGAGGTVDPLTTDTLTALAVDGTPITGFAPTTYSYTVDNGTAITSAVNADDNVGITILPKYEGSAYVVTLAENGTATQKYTVAMPFVEDPPVEVYTLTLDPKGGTVASTTVDLPAQSLPTPTRDGYHFVGWFKDEIDADTKQGYVRGRYLCGEPLTSATADDKDKILYAKWVKNDVYNHFQGKKAVFVGDSVSTLHGYAAVNRQVYTSNIFYTEAKAAEQGITATNTWWGQLVQALDMSLLSVNAVAGSPVTDSEPSITYDVRAMSSTARIDDLDVNGTPDVIFIFGGINDFNGNTKAPIDDYDPNASYLTDELDLTSDYFPTFAEGYATMLRRMRHYYPDAEIVAIGPYIAASDRDAYKPVFVKGNTTISNLCARFNVPYLNLMNTQLPYWANGVKLLCDSYHPNQAGFTEFANYVLENYVPACAHEHKTALTGVVAATCTTDGYSGDCTCEDCGETILGHVITKLGHDWSDWVTTKDPSTTETGLKKRECQREGCDAEETEEIPMIVDVVALRNVAVVTAVGVAPTLPEKVAGLKADGTVGGEYDVVWNEAAAPDAVGVTTVTGTAQVNGAAMIVSASVRAAAAAGGDLVNLTETATEGIVKAFKTNTNPEKWLMSVASFAANQWDDYIANVQYSNDPNTTELTLGWDSSVTVSEVAIYFNGTGGNYQPPANVKFYDDSVSPSTEIAFTAGEVVDSGTVYAHIVYTFSSPKTLSKIRFSATPDPATNARLLFTRRMWVYGPDTSAGGSVEPTTTDTLTALAVDGTPVSGFTPTTYNYSVDNGTAITSAVNTNDNVGVTILPKYEGSAYVVTLAENGTATQKYTVSMPAGEDPPVTGASVTLNANGGTVASTTVDLPAQSLPTPTRDGYHFVGWFEDKTLTSYDFTPGGSYVPGTFLYGTPVTAPSADYADKTLYAKWVKTSVYEHFHGKKVAVYGDSVSTLLGFVPSAESEMFNGGVFYGQDYVDKGINEHTQWWGQLVDALGMQLLEINAIGGSSVGAYAYEYGLERKAMMNYTRMRLLDDAGTPDVIIVAAGINDYNDSTTGFNANADYLTNELDRVTSICPDFAKAYALMIRRLQDLYPTTEIVALSSFDVGAAEATEIGNDCIRRTCALYNVVNIDMRNAFTLNDGTGVDYRPHGIHPGISGFAAIANCFLENYAPIANPVVVPDCGHTWDFGVLTTPATATASGVRTYTCRHCDATRTEAVPYVALSEETEADITSHATAKGVYLLPDDRQVMANTVDKQATPLASYNGYLESPANLIDGNADTIYKDWIMNDRYIAFTFDQPMVVTSVKLYGVMNRYPNKIQIVDPDNRLLGKTDGGIPYTSGQHQCTITTTERVANTEVRLAFDFEYAGKEFQLKEVEIFGYAAGTEPPIDPPDDPVGTDIVALRNIAVVTAVGTAPTLPAKVAGLKADGTVSGEYDVVWETAAAPSAVGITTVNGTAQVNGAAMTVTASVRAANASSGDAELVNVAPLASSLVATTPGTTQWDKDLVDLSAITNGWGTDMVIGGWNTPGNNWRIYTQANVDLAVNLDFAWSPPQKVSKIFIATFDDNQVGSLVIKDGSTGNELVPSSHKIDQNDYYKINFGDGHLYVFNEPITLSQLRIEAVKNTGGRWYGYYEIEVWAEDEGAGGTVDPLTTDTLSALAVDGNAVAGFAPTTYSYTVENGTAITSATSTDNVGITILPKYEGSAYVVTLAENGTATKKYTVAMPAAVPQATVKIIDRSGKETTVTKPLDEIVDAINSAVASADYGSKVILPALDTDYTVTLAPGVRVVKNADSQGEVTLVIPSAKSGWYVLNEAGDAMKLSEGAKPFVTDIQVADGASVVTIGNVKVDLYYAVIKSETLFGFETASVVATSGKIASGETFVFELPHGENEPQAFYKVLVTDDPAKADDPRGGGEGDDDDDDDPITVDITEYTWCSLGTSITDFNDDPITGRTKGYQFFLMDELEWDRAKLVNAGHSGTLVSSSSSKPPATPCDIYTVEYGVNDWGTGHPVGTLDDYKNYLYNGKAVRWNNFASCYRNLIEMIKAVNPNAVIVLITPRKAYGTSADAGTKMFPENCDDPTLASSVGDYYDPAAGVNVHGDQTYLKDYADLIKAIGAYEGFPVVDWYSSAATQANLASLSVDNAVHPNDAGYEIMAGLLKPVLLKAVQDKFGEGGGEGDEEDDDDDDPVRSAEYGPWNIQVMDPTHIVMQFDGNYGVEKNYVESGVFSTAPLSTDYALIKDASFKVNGTVTAQAGHAIAARGQMSYTNALGQTEIVGGTGNQNWELRAVHNLYLNLASALVEGTNTVVTPDERTLEFVYDTKTVSPLFKVNQVGYAASAAEKYVYLGGWLGTAGTFPLDDSYSFEVINASSGATALTGSFTKRMNDPTSGGVAMTGEKTLEADISALTTAGTYYVRVAGLGRSMDFRVSDDAAADQFAVHMLGLYQQRCGCAKEEPYTHWTDTCCHQKVYRGVHPSNDDEYEKCFGTAQNAFSIISANAASCTEQLSIIGGWHDAADYDRRPYHLQVVIGLANVYLMKPGNFTDGQLAIPEKNNGIPDILDEADWGLKFYLAAQQQDDGGVGGWAETVTHPDYGNKKMPSDDTYKLQYYLGRATRRSTLKYCGAAANLARALYAVGTAQATARADVYKASAVKAWNYVMDSSRQQNIEMKGPNGSTVKYTEPAWYDPYEYAKAAINLGVITGNPTYFNHLSDNITYRGGGRDNYNYGPDTGPYPVSGFFGVDWSCISRDESFGRDGFILSEVGLSCAADSNADYLKIKNGWINRVKANADEIITSMSSMMAYRNGALSAKAWGASGSLRNAEWLCAAHFFTGDAKYLKAAQLASDYQSGCNPLGMTWTSGLGKVYPVAFLSLHSFADSIAEYVPGITPFYNTGSDFGYLFNNTTMTGRYTNYQAETKAKPLWRRFEVGENMSIGISEYTVTETIGPCAAAAGYLINAGHTTANLNWRQPAAKLSDLPGYWALP